MERAPPIASLVTPSRRVEAAPPRPLNKAFPGSARAREESGGGCVFVPRGRGLGQSRRGPRGGRQGSFVTEKRWGGRARESREAGTWRPVGRAGTLNSCC